VTKEEKQTKKEEEIAKNMNARNTSPSERGPIRIDRHEHPVTSNQSPCNAP